MKINKRLRRKKTNTIATILSTINGQLATDDCKLINGIHITIKKTAIGNPKILDT
uniref:Bm687, isoform c n=1 Tax=Brugia malayi TaxID=6279 RepID=A0A1I9G4Z1_BRUMA|nr:Bm687, isoform c [Brugia malayi]